MPSAPYFGLHRDEEHEAKLQKLVDDFILAISNPRIVSSCTTEHISNTDRIVINPYRPPRGEAVGRQLFHSNVAEWGPVLHRKQSAGHAPVPDALRDLRPEVLDAIERCLCSDLEAEYANLSELPSR